VVAIELFRNRRRAIYFKGKGECDFVVEEGTRTFEGETLEVVPVWKWLLGASTEK
jgi:predicted AAA+ superfamily ATPase